MAHLTDHVDLATPFVINNKQSVILISMANYITDMMKMIMPIFILSPLHYCCGDSSSF
mgnify:CR=1 FL=1